MSDNSEFDIHWREKPPSYWRIVGRVCVLLLVAAALAYIIRTLSNAA